MINFFDIMAGSLLGDGSIGVTNKKYFFYKQTAKDKKFLEWLGTTLKQFGIRPYIFSDNQKCGTFGLGFYINTCPYAELLNFRSRWYIKENGRAMKIIPKDIRLNPTTLLFWYLGDGCLVRRKNDKNRLPTIVLATNCFSKEDIDFLIQKLKELGLNFYPVMYKSGFTGKKCGYCLYSKVEDGTPFRFFKLIGDCPDEIAGCSTGSKGIYREEKFFKNKWPTEEDWMKILSNVIEVGPILRETRLKLGLSQNQFGRRVNMRRENIRDVELMKRHFRLENFKKILAALDLDAPKILKTLSTGPAQTILSNL